mgnify:CR=1 FL=1
MTLDPATYSPAPAWAGTCGPRDAKVVIVGEAWGENEDLLRSPFVGWSGYELSRMMYEAELCSEPPLKQEQYSSLMLLDWWKRSGLLLTNTFSFRPPQNKIDFICGKKAEVGSNYSHPPIGSREGYVLPQYLAELQRLKEELSAYDRNVVVALGAKASWALLNSEKISKIRGVTTESTLCPGLKVIPTYHPAGIMRNWSWRAIAIADLMKAKRQSAFPEIHRPACKILVNPTILDVRAWLRRPMFEIGVDLETKARMIEMVGIAVSPLEAIAIPFLDKSKPDGNYWSAVDEREVWSLLRWRLEDPAITKVFQNGLYDLQYFIRRSPIRPRNCSEDTMLLHHSMFPESQKGLGFLGSIYTDHASWKLWRGKEAEELKRDE